MSAILKAASAELVEVAREYGILAARFKAAAEGKVRVEELAEEYKTRREKVHEHIVRFDALLHGTEAP